MAWVRRVGVMISYVASFGAFRMHDSRSDPSIPDSPSIHNIKQGDDLGQLFRKG